MSQIQLSHAEPRSDANRGWFRGDIDGLRAVAIVVVVAFHSHLPGFSGGFVGVDSFFVISGFLITRKLLAEADEHGRVGLLQFWARRARRLVPALALVIVATLFLTAFILSPLEWRDIPKQASAAAVYVSNILFARESHGYFDTVATESPFLHTWSLGVEEQFYVVWPVLFAACLAAARRLRRSRELALVSSLTVVFLLSFGLSIVLTAKGSAWAFYSLPTRAWEFTAAGLLATLAMPAVFQRRAVRLASVLVGGLLLTFAVVAFSDSSPYPGYRALVPVIGTMLLILAGTPSTTASVAPVRLLSTRPAQALGRVSYSWYLWHWPFIVFAIALFDVDSTLVRSAAALASLPVAVLAYRYFENPIRFNRSLTTSLLRTFAAAAAITIALLVSAFGFAKYSTQTLSGQPYAALVAIKNAQLQFECAEQSTSADGIVYCVDGDLSAEKTVMLIGDSHARQWKGAFSAAASEMEVKLVVRWAASCPSLQVKVTARVGTIGSACENYQRDTEILVDELKPDLIVIANTTGYLGGIRGADGAAVGEDQQVDIWRQAFVDQVERFRGAGHAVAWVPDNPDMGFDTLVCASRRGNTDDDCRRSRTAALGDGLPLRTAEDGANTALGGLPALGTVESLCDADWCYPHRDGVYAFADENHLSQVWTATQVARVKRLFADGHLGG